MLEAVLFGGLCHWFFFHGKEAYLLFLGVQRGAEWRAQSQARRRGGRLSELVLHRVRARHGIARFLGVPSGREYHHHSGQRQRPSLLNEASHPRSGGQRAEGQRLALSAAAAVRAVGTARAILLHARGGPALSQAGTTQSRAHDCWYSKQLEEGEGRSGGCGPSSCQSSVRLSPERKRKKRFHASGDSNVQVGKR